MSEWQGFVIESKRYMNHPDFWKQWDWLPYKMSGWTETKRRKAILKFWLAFPRVWIRYHWYCLRDLIIKMILLGTQYDITP